MAGDAGKQGQGHGSSETWSSTLQVEVRRSDVQSAWSGLRPLAMDPNAADTASASRDHIVTQDPDGLITVTGGLRNPYTSAEQPAG